MTSRPRWTRGSRAAAEPADDYGSGRRLRPDGRAHGRPYFDRDAQREPDSHRPARHRAAFGCGRQRPRTRQALQELRELLRVHARAGGGPLEVSQPTPSAAPRPRRTPRPRATRPRSRPPGRRARGFGPQTRLRSRRPTRTRPPGQASKDSDRVAAVGLDDDQVRHPMLGHQLSGATKVLIGSDGHERGFPRCLAP